MNGPDSPLAGRRPASPKKSKSRGQILKEIAALEANLPQQHKTKEEIIREMQLLESRIEHLQTAGLSAIVCLFPSLFPASLSSRPSFPCLFLFTPLAFVWTSGKFLICV